MNQLSEPSFEYDNTEADIATDNAANEAALTGAWVSFMEHEGIEVPVAVFGIEHEEEERQIVADPEAANMRDRLFSLAYEWNEGAQEAGWNAYDAAIESAPEYAQRLNSTMETEAAAEEAREKAMNAFPEDELSVANDRYMNMLAEKFPDRYGHLVDSAETAGV